MDRSSIISGILATATSMGAVIKLSTSCTANDGASEIICTWLLVISGIASIGSFDNEYAPQPIKATMNNPTMNLFLIEKEMIPSIIIREILNVNI
jgi:hypothetical protein